MVGRILLNTGDSTLSRASLTLCFTGFLGLAIHRTIVLAKLGLLLCLQALVRILELDWWVHRVWARCQTGVHMAKHVFT